MLVGGLRPLDHNLLRAISLLVTSLCSYRTYFSEVLVFDLSVVEMKILYLVFQFRYIYSALNARSRR